MERGRGLHIKKEGDVERERLVLRGRGRYIETGELYK